MITEIHGSLENFRINGERVYPESQVILWIKEFCGREYVYSCMPEPIWDALHKLEAERLLEGMHRGCHGKK